jgi:RHS repeat-associated protein
VSKVHDDIADTANVLDQAFSFIYDANDRLAQERVISGTNPLGTIGSTTLYEYGTLSSGGALTPGTPLARVTKYQGSNTTATGTKLDQTQYRYDVAGRTAEVKVESFGTSPSTTTTRFTYDDAGQRLSQRVTIGSTTTTTLYTVDVNNPTGYAQVIEEITTTSGAGGAQVRTSYTIGLDVIAQQKGTRSGSSWTPSDPQTLLYDGHGSTRALMIGNGPGNPDANPPILPARIAADQVFDYDAYGQMLPRYASSSATSEIVQTPATTLLYAGEQTDRSTGLQYLRARYYSPASGRFTQMDQFAGVQSDPQSLHKYLYAHANPVMNVDPSGEIALGVLFSHIDLHTAEISVGLALVELATGDIVGASALFAEAAQSYISAFENLTSNGSATATRLTQDALTLRAKANANYAYQLRGIYGDLVRDQNKALRLVQDAMQDSRFVSGVAQRTRLPQLLGKPHDSVVLRSNLERAGFISRPGDAAHHIIPTGGKIRTPQSLFDFLKREGIDVNAADNGVFLPRANGTASGMPNHRPIHTKRYYEALRQRLDQVPLGRGREELAKIAVQIENNLFP